MEDLLTIDKSLGKEEKYLSLIPQIKALITGETDLIANLANISSALKHAMDFFWVGFYIVRQDELVLGPFQGPTACTRIRKGRGVCGKSWESGMVIIVDDVDQFPGHIACNPLSKSEIVLPIIREQVTMVLDVDSSRIGDFDTIDEKYLQQVVDLLP